jgi:hypothetical protein
MAVMRAVAVGLAIALLGLGAACGSDESDSGGASGSGGNGAVDAGGDAEIDAGPICPTNGISKGPWSLRVDQSSAVVRWEACRAGALGDLTADDQKGGGTLNFTSTQTPFVVNNTYKAVLNPTVPADEAGTYYMHEVKLSGLSPATCYRYSLGADTTLSGKLCTARASGESFQFLALADTNPGLGTSTREMLSLIDPESYDFTVHGGDVQYYASGLETWASWFPSMAPMLRHGAFLPSIGNHESEKDDEYDQYYLRFFGAAGFDGTDAYYRFESGGVWFFSLDTESELGAGSAQLAWLQAELADAASKPGYRFSVLYFHRPMLTCGDTSQSDTARSLIEPMMDQYRVELVLQGHMHGYERFESPRLSNANETVTYLTIGGGGGALGNIDQNSARPTCALRVASGAFYHVALIEVGPTTLSGKILDPTGMLKDSFQKTVP